MRPFGVWRRLPAPWFDLCDDRRSGQRAILGNAAGLRCGWRNANLDGNEYFHWRYIRVFRLRRGFVDGYSDADAYPVAHSDPNSYTNGNPDANGNPDSYAYANRNAHADTDGDPNADADTWADSQLGALHSVVNGYRSVSRQLGIVLVDHGGA